MSDTVQEPLTTITTFKPWSSFPILSKKTLVEADPSRGIYPIRHFEFGYPTEEALSFRFTTEVLKMVRSDTGAHKSYSPTSEPDEKGKFELMVRIYPGGGHSEWLDSQPIGTRVSMFGPIPPPKLSSIIAYSPGKRIIAIALGIGITEVYSTVREELRGKPDTKVTLLQSVRYRDELVLQREIRNLLQQFPDRLDVQYVATKEDLSSEGWRYGRIKPADIDEIIGDFPKDDTRILIVGTKKMIQTMWDDLATIGLDKYTHSLVRKRSPIEMAKVNCSIA